MIPTDLAICRTSRSRSSRWYAGKRCTAFRRSIIAIEFEMWESDIWEIRMDDPSARTHTV